METQNTITVTRVTDNGTLMSVGMTPMQFAKYDHLLSMADDMNTIEEHDYFVEAMEFFNDLYTVRNFFKGPMSHVNNI